MVTAEGVFPKDGNDPLFNSEVNKFNPKLIGAISQHELLTVPSGTDFSTLGGSVLYSGTGPTQISDFMIINTGTTKNTTSQILFEFRLRISGTDGLDFATPIKSNNSNNTFHFNFNHVLTSGAINASGGNVGSPYVISLESRTPQNAGGAISDFTVLGY